MEKCIQFVRKSMQPGTLWPNTYFKVRTSPHYAYVYAFRCVKQHTGKRLMYHYFLVWFNGPDTIQNQNLGDGIIISL